MVGHAQDCAGDLNGSANSLAAPALVPAAGDGAWPPQWLPEPLGSGATCHPSPQRVNEGLAHELRRPPSDSSFRYFCHQLDVAALCAAIRDWTIGQIPSGAADLDQLVCDGKALRGSIETTARGGLAFIAQVTLYSAALGVAISQTCYAKGENYERAVLRQLHGELDLDGVLIQADALDTQKPVFGSSRSRGPTSS
jgi:hypothetical protein